MTRFKTLELRTNTHGQDQRQQHSVPSTPWIYFLYTKSLDGSGHMKTKEVCGLYLLSDMAYPFQGVRASGRP